MILNFYWILMYAKNKIYEFSLENVLSDYSYSTIINTVPILHLIEL